MRRPSPARRPAARAGSGRCRAPRCRQNAAPMRTFRMRIMVFSLPVCSTFACHVRRSAGRQYTVARRDERPEFWRWPIAGIIACALWPPRTVSAHDIPNDVTVQAFVKPDGQRAPGAGARAAQGDARRRIPHARRRPARRGPRGHRPARRGDDLAGRTTSSCYEGDTRARRRRASPPCAPRCRPTSRSARTTRRSHTSPARRCRPTRSCSGARG